MTNALIAHLQDLFADFGKVSVRSMFGGHGIYIDGLFVAIAFEDAVYLKTDAQTVPRFAAAGCAPFVYRKQKQPIELGYWSVPEAAMDSPEEMRPWLQLAREAALRKGSSTTGRKRKP